MNSSIPIDSFLDKLAFSVRFDSIRFFANTAIESQSRIIIRDDIVTRLHAAAPFLTLDQRPLHRHHERQTLLDRRRLRHDRPLPLLPAQRLE